uniref:metal-dependent hydrolase n=1 Tax=Thaumasiovibrio occultus TaxID=1891184 RepID=UPI000B359DAC|nr:metal-dependent hydrolase [Thaumasiovibrio occultus]
MLIAHLPAGFLLTYGFIQRQKRVGSQPISTKKITALWIAGLLFSVLPDFDMLYFTFVDSRYHHHLLFPHLPIFWLGLLPLLYALTLHPTLRAMRSFVHLLSLNIALHLILDTWAGDIWWLYPWSTDPIALITVPATQSHWVWSFMLHWSFIPELFIVAAALALLIKQRKNNAAKKQ